MIPIERTPCEHLYDIACRELSEVMVQRDELLATVKALSDDWKERARRVRPLESARLTAAKRAAIAEWICLTNRAIELDAIIAKAEGK
jgi:hypothetical protein